MKRSWVLYGVAALSTLLFLLLQLYDPSQIKQYVESRTYDLRLSLRNVVTKPQPPENIVIVTVDEKSIAEVGRWPWSRKVMARLIDKVSSCEPKVIGVDILFTEPESPEADGALADAIGRAGNVVLATVFFAEKQKGVERADVDYLWDHAFMQVKSTEALDWKSWLIHADSVLAPLEELAAASSLGSVYTLPDRDGYLRNEVLYLFYEEDFYPSLALQTARTYLGVPMDDMELIGGAGVRLGDLTVPTDLYGRMRIDYLGPEGSFKYISAVDVLKGMVPPETFKGKAVLVGTSAVGTYDVKVTPLSANMPGVEKNATVVENILTKKFIRPSPGFLEMGITLVTALMLSIFIRRRKAVESTLFAISLMGLYLFFSVYVLTYNMLDINVTYPMANMLVIFLSVTTLKFFFEEKKAKEIRRMFSSYVSPSVVEALIANPDLAKLGGQRMEVTVLFSDIAGFTSFSEKHQPEEVVAHLNEFFKEMTDVIFKWEGTFDKIVGDEIMAFWGAPTRQPNHPELAIRCALDMIRTLSRLQEKWRREGKPVLECGIGLNTGEVLVGNIGAEDKKMDYTVIGDHVNAAARVEALTRSYNATILITEHTAAKIKGLIDEKKLGHVEMRFRDSVRVKGKAQELGIYQIIDTEIKSGGLAEASQ